MTDIKAGFVVAASIVLAGCATANIQPEDMSKLGAAPTLDDVNKIAHGEPLRRLDYLVDGQTYTFEVYEATDTAKYYDLLFQGGKLIAVDIAGANSNSTGPWTCTLFPPKPGMDVEACLRGVDKALQASSVDLRQPVAPDQKALQRAQNEKTGAVAETAFYTALFAPIMIPLAAVALPVMGVAEAGDKSRRDSLNVKLGDSYADIRGNVEQYPEKFRSITDGSGTVLIPGAVVPNASAAFGVAMGKVIWIDLSPYTACGGGFMFWGMTCSMGASRPAAWHAPHRPRPPVIDEWENIAVYYTPPPQFDVLGETAGKAEGGFTAKGRTENAMEDMKKWARKDGATALLMKAQYVPADQEPTAAPAAGTGTPVYGADAVLPLRMGWASAVEIYVPADADAFLKAAKAHATSCDALSQKKDDMKDAYKAVKDAGTPAEVAAAKANLQAAEDAADAAYCGDDNWYAEQMTAQKR